MNDEFIEEDDEDFSTTNPHVKKDGDILDEDPEGIDDLAEEEDEEEEPYEDVDPF